jgi:hypothetical protein
MRVSKVIALIALAAGTLPASAARTGAIVQLASPVQSSLENPPVPVGGPYAPPIGLGFFEPDVDYYEDSLDLPALWESLQD